MQFKGKQKQQPAEEFQPVWGQAYGIEQFDQPEILQALEGKIISLFDPESKEGQYGTYTYQNGKIETECGEIEVKFWDMEIPKSARGKKFVAALGRAQKGGLIGIEYKIDSWTNKKTGADVIKEVIHIKPPATFQVLGGFQGQPAHKQQQPANQSSQPQGRKTQESHFVPDKPQLIDVATHLIEQHRQIHNLVSSAYDGEDSETKRAYVASLWIALDRVGAISYDPTVALGSRKDAPVSHETHPEGDDSGYDPEDWGSAIVPSGSMKGKKLAEIGKQAIIQLHQYAESNGEKNAGFWACVYQAFKDVGGPVKTPPMDADDIPF